MRDQIADVFSQPDISNRRSLSALGFSLEWDKIEVVREQQRLVHFRQVVVFASHPENRHARNTGRLNLPSQCQSRSHFHERQQRSAKKPDLLTGDNSVCSFPEALDIFQGCIRGTPGTVLPLKHVGYPAVDLGSGRNRFCQ